MRAKLLSENRVNLLPLAGVPTLYFPFSLPPILNFDFSQASNRYWFEYWLKELSLKIWSSIARLGLFCLMTTKRVFLVSLSGSLKLSHTIWRRRESYRKQNKIDYGFGLLFLTEFSTAKDKVRVVDSMWLIPRLPHILSWLKY